jgi:signal peptidase I
MEPTLSLGAQVPVAPAALRVGEIVVYHPPENAGLLEQCGPTPHKVVPGGAPCAQPLPDKQSKLELVKRIVAGPGDSIAIRDGHVFRNGQPQPDSYIKPCPSGPQCNFPTPVTVLPGHWYLLGDNRGESNDSRFWGPVPTAWIVGVVQGPATV